MVEEEKYALIRPKCRAQHESMRRLRHFVSLEYAGMRVNRGLSIKIKMRRLCHQKAQECEW